MSDNPADSLRLELEAGLRHLHDEDCFAFLNSIGSCSCTATEDVRSALAAALEAARADERAKIEKAILAIPSARDQPRQTIEQRLVRLNLVLAAIRTPGGV